MHLWSDLEDNQQPLAKAGRGRTRRLTELSALASLRQWLLNAYVAEYCRSLAATRIFRRCYLVDALGIVSKGRASTAMSTPHPVLQPICVLAQTLAQESKPIMLYGLLLTYGSSKRKDARQDGIKEHRIPKESGVINASWLETASHIMQELEQTPAIFLLNPFGHTMFTSDDLTSLYKRTAPTELCLLLSHKQVEDLFLTALRSHAYAIALTTILRTDRWKALPTQDPERKKTIHALIDLFAASIQRNFVLPIQQITLPVLVRPAIVEDMPYTLVFATRRQDSFVSMNEALCHYQRTIYEQSHHGVLGEEWFETQYQERIESERQRLQETLLQQGRAQRVRRWPDLRQQVLQANFGHFLLHDYDTLLQQFLQSGEVRCEWRRQPTEDETERLPGNDDTLLWPEERTAQKERGSTRGKH
ncbi:MAG: hypothetical protein NVS4B11_37060 [Ktedonobacteraceae bacterium]